MGLCPRGSHHGLKWLVRVEAQEMLVWKGEPFPQDSQLKEVAACSTLVRLLVWRSVSSHGGVVGPWEGESQGRAVQRGIGSRLLTESG